MASQRCPRCAHGLTLHPLTERSCSICSACHGWWVPFALLRQNAQPGLASRLWLDSQDRPARGKALRCPNCQQGMSTTGLCPGVELDLCRQCQSLWFDADEIEQVRVARRDGLLDKLDDVRELSDLLGGAFEILSRLDPGLG